MEQGKKEKALALIERILERVPDYHFAHFHAGSHYFQQMEFEKAEEHLDKALALSSHNPVYYTFMGKVRYEQGKYAESREAFTKAIDLDPGNQMSHDYLAICFLKEGNVEQFKNIIAQRGVFESLDFQIDLIWALESHLRRKIT